MKHRLLFLPVLALISGCVEPPLPEHYELTTRKLKRNEFEATIKADPGIDMPRLKQILARETKDICGNKVGLLRGMKEQEAISGDAKKVTYRKVIGEIDCVPVSQLR